MLLDSVTIHLVLLIAFQHLQFASTSGIVDVHLCNLPMCMEDQILAMKAFLEIDIFAD
jgi:hypothetical protein